MANYDSSDVAFFLVDGYSILGTTTDITIEAPLKVEDVTPLGASAEVFASTGLTSSKMSQKGLFDDAAGSSHAALVSKNGVTRVICFGVEGNVIGKNFVGLSGAIQTKYDPELKVGALHKASADYQGTGSKEDGKILHALGTETDAGNSQATYVDNGAQTTAGGVGYVQLPALTLGGYTDLRIYWRHSTDNVTWADIAVGPLIATGAPGAACLLISGTIYRYTACLWDFTGTGSGPAATFMVGIVRN